MGKFWYVVNKVIQQADIIMEILDARLINETRNSEIERKIAQSGKKILYVVTKCDLVEQDTLRHLQKELYPSVYVSGVERFGTTILKKKILELSEGNPVTVGVVGYPNVGKSSIINALAGRHAARTSPESGFTKGVQKVRVDHKIMLLDTPGVFPYKEKNEVKHGLMGAYDYAKVKDPEVVVLGFIEKHTEMVKKFYKVKGDDIEDILERIALKLQRLRKGGRPDLEATARAILKDWQTGKMRKV